MKRTGKKLFVLDTNVLISDPSAIFKFQEHDLFIPFTVLEELDKHKKGQTEISRNARQASRNIEKVFVSDENPSKGYSLGENKGNIYFSKLSVEDLKNSGIHINDNIIISQAIEQLQTNRIEKPSNRYDDVVLVSKDINVRIKGSTLGITTEDYENDYAIKDEEILSSGIINIDFENIVEETLNYTHEKEDDYITMALSKDIIVSYNNFITIDDNEVYYQIIEIEELDDSNLIKARKAKDYTNKSKAWGVVAKNIEQNLALNLLLDDDVKFITLLGPAGTGKTILTLAAALERTIEDNKYNKILVTRATVTVGEEIGFLPGTEEEKMAAWMGNMYDNLESLLNVDKEAEKKAVGFTKKDSLQMVMDKIEVKSIGFMRGRSFQRRFIIIDEAQNLSPKEMRMLLTRAGEGTKIICMGNLSQIDTPYMTEYTSGLTHVVKRMNGWKGNGSLILNKTVRSELSEQAETRLSNS